jgi:Tol biopolymer transport system component
MENRQDQRALRRTFGPAAATFAGFSAFACLCLAASGCWPRRAEALYPPSGIDGSGGREGMRPDLAALVGKPYRDLRRHTAYQIGEVSGIDVSPDGTRLLYSSTQDGTTPNLYLKDESGAGVIRKTSGRFSDIHPRFSPDGRWIAFASNRDGNFDIWIIPAEGAGGAEQLTSSPDDEVHPSWSPEGRKIALCRLSAAQGWNLWVLDHEGQGAVELGPGLFPDWSPTGEWIAFQKQSEREPHWFGLWIIRPDGSEVRQLVAGDGFGAMEPTWSPGGDLLAFTAVKRPGDPSRRAAGEIWVVEVSHGKRYQITDGPGADAAPVWGLQDRIYFTSDRLGARSIWSLIPPEVAE